MNWGIGLLLAAFLFVAVLFATYDAAAEIAEGLVVNGQPCELREGAIPLRIDAGEGKPTVVRIRCKNLVMRPLDVAQPEPSEPEPEPEEPEPEPEEPPPPMVEPPPSVPVEPVITTVELGRKVLRLRPNKPLERTFTTPDNPNVSQVIFRWTSVAVPERFKAEVFDSNGNLLKLMRVNRDYMWTLRVPRDLELQTNYMIRLTNLHSKKIVIAENFGFR